MQDSTLPKALLLDVGWTLLHPRHSMWQIFAEVGEQAGAPLSAAMAEKTIYELMRHTRDNAIARLEADAPHLDSDEEFVAQFDAIGRLIFAAADVPGDPALLMRRFLDRFWDGNNWVVFPDVSAALDRIRSLGIRVGVLSNAASTLLDFLDHHGLLDRFDFTVVSAVVGHKKPDRRIFEIALERAGSRPAETVHVGDMYVEDILGAHHMGIRSFLIDRGKHAMFPNHREKTETLPGGVRVVRSLSEVITALESNSA